MPAAAIPLGTLINLVDTTVWDRTPQQISARPKRLCSQGVSRRSTGLTRRGPENDSSPLPREPPTAAVRLPAFRTTDEGPLKVNTTLGGVSIVATNSPRRARWSHQRDEVTVVLNEAEHRHERAPAWCRREHPQPTPPLDRKGPLTGEPARSGAHHCRYPGYWARPNVRSRCCGRCSSNRSTWTSSHMTRISPTTDRQTPKQHAQDSPEPTEVNRPPVNSDRGTAWRPRDLLEPVPRPHKPVMHSLRFLLSPPWIRCGNLFGEHL